MDVVPEGTEPTPGFLASPSRPQSRIGGFRGRPISGLPGLTRATSISAAEMRVGLGADASTSPTGLSSPEPAMARSVFIDSLSSIGLPGEEAATFEPLIIEPYEPAVSITSTNTPAAGASPDQPQSPLTPPTATPPPTASHPSPTATAAAVVGGAVIQPKPPPGSALKRFASSRRSLVRQASQTSSGGAAAAPASTTYAVASPPGAVADSLNGGSGGAATAAAAAAASATTAAAGGGSGALPAAPRTPLPSVTDVAPLVPPSPALSVGEVPVVVFDPTAIPPLPGVAGGVADGKATSSFLDPSKPAVRRLLPPLLRASQALHDGASADVSPTALDEAAMEGCTSPFAAAGRGGGAGGGGMASPAGGAGGPESCWAELQETFLTASTPASESLVAPLLCVDVCDTASPRGGGRRALPPMDPLRTSATAMSLSAVSTSEAAAEAEPLTPAEPVPFGAASPGYGDAAAAAGRRSPSARPLPWDVLPCRDEAPGREQRTWAGGASEAGECVTAVDGCGGLAVMHRTASFHAFCSGGGGGGNGAGQLLLDVSRLRGRSTAIPPDLTLVSPTGGAAGVGGASSSGGGAESRRESGRLSRTSSQHLASARTLAATTAALPPILDRSGIDRRQTLTN